MAIIVDPDNLDREQVIFGTVPQKLSIRDVGLELTSALNRRITGETKAGLLDFVDTGAQFQTWGVSPGNALLLFTKDDSAHYIVNSVTNETTMSIAADGNDFSAFIGATNIVYSVHHVTGGTVLDGATEQAIYSFAKEEWRVDTETFGNDDLIRHPFPFEAVTREQMEIGGGLAHDDWTWFNEYTRKKIRTGGWADKNTASVTNEEWTGIVTLGTLDTDTQVYYQPLSGTANPIDFTFQGAVNEAIATFISGTSFDTRAFLKLFARKKGKTFSQSTISDIGVTSIETIVNRFPLAHADDPAIVTNDAEILGNTPWRNQNTLFSVSDGNKTAGTTEIRSTTGGFTNAIAGDTVHLTSGLESGYYTIASIGNNFTASIAADTEFTTWSSTESSLTFDATTTDIIRRTNKALTIQNINGLTGAVTSSDAQFTIEGVAADDLLHILEDNNIFAGIYTVISRSNDNLLVVNTTDRQFPTSPSGTLDYKVTEPGMYLQFKKDIVNATTTGDLIFTGSGQLSRSLGNWGNDGFTTGSVLTVAGSTNNNKSFTIASNVNDNVVQFVVTDVITNETASSATVTGFNAFKRVVNGVTYAFTWDLFGNNTTLGNQYEFVQHQLRQSTDIDHMVSSSRGDVTDLLMSFQSPNATTFSMYIDDLDATDINNVTFRDATNVDRTEKFVAAGSITFNENLQSDTSAVYAMFFTNDDAGDNTGRDYGTPNAIVVRDADGIEISGSIAAQASVSFTYDYDLNVQRGAASAGTNAPVTIVAIGLDTAQFVIAQSTIARTKTNNIALVAALERNYSNPT